MYSFTATVRTSVVLTKEREMPDSVLTYSKYLISVLFNVLSK